MTRPRVLVVGDSMLDRYWSGVADRLSPEAPVPVLLMRERTARAGGAANVALNAAALGCDVTLVTLVGDDAAGNELIGLLDGVNVMPVTCEATTEKIRAISRRHQLLRIDFDVAPSASAVEVLTKAAMLAVADYPVVVLSDYAKGALGQCDKIIRHANAAGCRVLVDPKGRYWERYRGAWLVKPNEAEMAAVLEDGYDDADNDNIAMHRAEMQIEHLLVTRGERGMTLCSAGQPALDVPADAREVFDVCGAGDTVLATLAAMLARGQGIYDAVRMANRAAGIAVSRFGTTAVTMEDLAL